MRFYDDYVGSVDIMQLGQFDKTRMIEKSYIRSKII